MDTKSFTALFTPDYACATGLLKHLNSDELKELLNSDEKLESLIKDLQQVKDIEAEREMLMASNKSLSEFNLSQKPTLEDNCHQLEELYQNASDLKCVLVGKKSQLEKVKSQRTLDTVLALLQSATAEIEEEAELYVERFLNGETPIETFLDEYLEKRKQVHLRRTKSEKLAALLQKQERPIISQPAKPPRVKKTPPPIPSRPSPSSGISYGNFNPFSGEPIVPMRQAPQPPVPYPQMNFMPQYPRNAFFNAPTTNVQSRLGYHPQIPPVYPQQPYPNAVRYPRYN